MYIKSVEFTNLRCFKQGKLDFRYPGDGKVLPEGVPNLENVNVILGVNGAGKTTVLKAVALGLMAQFPRSTGFVANSLVRREKEKDFEFSSIKLEICPSQQENVDLVASSRFETKIQKIRSTEEILPINNVQNKAFYDDSSSEFFMVAYGATRRMETGDFEASSRRKSRLRRYEQIASLFEDHLALVPFHGWLRDVSQSQQKRIKLFLDSLLPTNLELWSSNEKTIFFKQDGVKIPFSALSDGYRAYISWIMDLLYNMLEASRENQFEGLNGVVMVDEIDLHVHPSWQKTIISQVANAFPNLQFIFTTHSPIVAGSVSSENLWITKIAPDGSSILERPHTEIYGLSADQILTSDIFGLQSTRADKFLQEMDILEQKAIRGDEEAALALMRGMARGKGAVTPKEPPAWVKQASAKRKKL
jgi:predicted ATP-binding protein involved in virulence